MNTTNAVTRMFEDHPIRTLTKDNGHLWFIAKDVAEVLGYSNTSKAVNQHCKAVSTCPNEMGGQVRHLQIIPERDVYRLIMRSKLPAAVKFEEWVTGEVLPSIRKHGGYLTPVKLEEALLSPDTIIRLATDLKREQEQRKEAESRIQLNRPKVVFAESLEVSNDTILVGELAKLIKQSTGKEIGQRRFFKWLRENGYLHKRGSDRNMPTQRSMELGIFVIKEGIRIGAKGSHITKTPKVTGKGQVYFITKFKAELREVA